MHPHLRRFSTAAGASIICAVLLLTIASFTAQPDAAADAGTAAAAAGSVSALRKLLQSSRTRPTPMFTPYYRPPASSLTAQTYRPTSYYRPTYRPTSYRPTRTTYRPTRRPPVYRPPRPAAAAAAANQTSVLNQTATNKPVNKCQSILNGVPMYNFGAPGCD